MTLASLELEYVVPTAGQFRARATNADSYFSFATLTSTGYGDIVPIHPLARSLTNLECVFGQLYPATILARLVTLELRAVSS